MIVTISDLIQSLVVKEKETLAKMPDLNHNGMLGDMYEGLSKKIIESAIFQNLNIRVVGGKVRLRDGTLSGQMDVMIVEGDGEQLPYTSHWIYDLEKVIAIIEVKKTLYKDDLADAFLHLMPVRDKSPVCDKRNIPLISDAWRSIMRRSLPDFDEIKELSPRDSLIRTMLILDAHSPLRIILGYGGYRSEHQLRKGLVDFISTYIPSEKKLDKAAAGFGVKSFPELIVCDEVCIVKLNGMPYYAASKLLSNFLPVLGSMSGNPFRTILELIWTRLTYRFELSAEIFGDDLEHENINILMDAQWNIEGQGWECRATDISEKELRITPKFSKWEPVQLTDVEFVILNALCQGRKQLITDSGLINYLKSKDTTPEKIAQLLSDKRLAYLSGDEIRLLTDNLACVMTSDGCFAGENKTGHMTRWAMRVAKAAGEKDLHVGK